VKNRRKNPAFHFRSRSAGDFPDICPPRRHTHFNRRTPSINIKWLRSRN